MKKIVTFVLLCAIMLTHSFSAAFADVPKNDRLFVVITNAAGDVVEKIPIAKQIYLEDTYTLAPGESLTTYQYEPKSSFYAGFDFISKNGETTTRNATVLIEIYGSSTIGADGKTLIKKHAFSTNIEANENSPYYDDAILPSVFLTAAPTETMRYFNARFTNQSSKTIKLCLFAGMD